MNYWWRVYAHLAPLLPGTVLLANVKRKALEDSPEPPFPRWKVPLGMMKGIYQRMVESVDNDRVLKRLSREMEHWVNVYARERGVTEIKAFRRFYTRGRDKALSKDEYNKLYRFYRGQKWEWREEPKCLRLSTKDGSTRSSTRGCASGPSGSR